jgi:hypothetical protein
MVWKVQAGSYEQRGQRDEGEDDPGENEGRCDANSEKGAVEEEMGCRGDPVRGEAKSDHGMRSVMPAATGKRGL